MINLTEEIYKRALHAFENGDLTHALDICDSIKLESASDDIVFLKSQIYFKLGDIDNCRQVLGYLVERDPEHINGLINLGVLDGMKGDYSLALQYFRKVLKLDPNNNFIKYNMAVTLIHMGQVDQAIEMLRTVEGELKNYGQSDLTIGEALDAKGLHEEAIKVYESIIDKNPSNIDAMNHKALSLGLLNRTEDARDILRDIVDVEPDNIEALATLAVTLYNEKAYHEALKYIERVIGLHSSSSMQNYPLISLMRDLRFNTIKMLVEENKKKVRDDALLP